MLRKENGFVKHFVMLEEFYKQTISKEVNAKLKCLLKELEKDGIIACGDGDENNKFRKIYMIVSGSGCEIYVGETVVRVDFRVKAHKRSSWGNKSVKEFMDDNRFNYTCVGFINETSHKVKDLILNMEEKLVEFFSRKHEIICAKKPLCSIML